MREEVVEAIPLDIFLVCVLPDLSQQPQTIASDDLCDLRIRVAVLYHPPGDVLHALGGVLHSPDVLEPIQLLHVHVYAQELVLLPAAGARVVAQPLLCVVLQVVEVEADVVSVVGVGSAADVVYAYEVDAVLDVLHVGVDPMQGVLLSHGKVRGSLDGHDAPALPQGLDDLVREHAGGRRECPDAAVAYDYGLTAELDGVQRRPVADMAHVH